MNRSDPFTTVRGDEWWYDDAQFEMELEYQPAAGPPAISIGTVRAKGGRLDAGQLHRLLFVTQTRFPELQVRCILHDNVSAQLSALSQSGAVEVEVIAHPYSKEAKFLAIHPPK
jgi:hypothetical protein